MPDTPRTKAGRALLEREAYNSRSFVLIDANDIIAIENEAIDALTAADPWAEVQATLPGECYVVVTLNTLGTYVAAVWPGGNYVGDPTALTDHPEPTADAALRALAAILRGES